MTARFKAPTPLEVEEYANTIGFAIDGEEFVDYYEACGWVVGKACKPMKSWKAAIRQWKRTQKEKRPQHEKPMGTWELKTKIESARERANALWARRQFEYLPNRDKYPSDWKDYLHCRDLARNLKKKLTE